MEHDKSREELLAAGKKKLNNFRAKQSSGSISHKKRRSHSRGNSIVSLDDMGIQQPPAIPSPPRSRPSSHHRRRSSVSTRRESSEIMGVMIPEDGLKESTKVDMHLRALFALEGRSSNATSPMTASFGFSKVELPDFGADVEKKADSTGMSKPSFNTNNSLAGKRDSFGKLLTPASGPKKELQTLLEEDEGDDMSAESVVPVPAPRHRPRSLNLRASMIKASASLPTPSPTPASRTPKLKSLTLASSTVTTPPKNNSRRQSALVTSTSSPLLSTLEIENTRVHRSISYRRTVDTEDSLCLPTNPQILTPSPSPTFERHRRSLSPTEFLAQSHTSLLVARIAELEAALGRMASPSPASTEPSEELLEMLSDLKTERDQLKRSLDELLARYTNQEKDIATLGRHLDKEKRDGWVSKEKLSRAEVEKAELAKQNESLTKEITSLRDQLQNIRIQLQIEKNARYTAESELATALETPKVPDVPYPYPTSYRHSQSADSEVTNSDGQGFSISVRLPSPDIKEEDDDRDSERSFRSRSVSSASCSSGILSRQPSSVSTPDELSQRRDSLSSGWSFAKASRKVKPKASVDHFFSCLEDSDGSMRVEPIASPSLKSTTGSYNIGFGLSPDEDEDSNFNFGQPSAPSPFPPSDESDDEVTKAVSPAPFIDEEDSTFSFATPEEFGISPSSSANTSLSQPTIMTSPTSPTVPNYVEPATPRPRHKARDSMHLRRRSRLDRGSIEMSGPTSTPSTPRSSKSPASSESGNSFAFPRAAFPTRTSAPTLDVSIPSDGDDFGSWTLSFECDSPTSTRNPTSDKSQQPQSRPAAPVFLPSPSRSMGTQPHKKDQQPLPTPPPSTPSKSPLANLSFSALAGLLPASWSPRTTPVASPTSSAGRNSFDRALVSRERQLNRLRSEVIEQFGSQSASEHERNRSGSYAI